jgi:hypothetical protein
MGRQRPEVWETSSTANYARLGLVRTAIVLAITNALAGSPPPPAGSYWAWPWRPDLHLFDVHHARRSDDDVHQFR